MPKHNKTWFMARRQDRNKKTGIKIRCAFCNEMSNPTCLDCVITMRYGHERETCMVFLTESSSLGMCRTCLEAVTMSNNVHDTSPRGQKRSLLLQKGDGTAKRRFYKQVRQSWEQVVP